MGYRSGFFIGLLIVIVQISGLPGNYKSGLIILLGFSVIVLSMKVGRIFKGGHSQISEREEKEYAQDRDISP